jgi:hypothetical protein
MREHVDETGTTARRVRLQTGEVLGWIGEPEWHAGSGTCIAPIVPAPVYRAAGQWSCPEDDGSAYLPPDPGCPPHLVLNVYGCEIAHASLCPDMIQHCYPNLCPVGLPCTNYLYCVQAIAPGMDTGDEANYSECLWLNTNTTWGDIASSCAGNVCKPPNAIVGLDDVMAIIKCYQAVPVAPMTWCDIAPSSGTSLPDQNVGIADILGAISGFQGSPYPGVGPNNCP